MSLVDSDPINVPCLSYIEDSWNNFLLKVVYRIDDRYMSIRIYRNNVNETIYIESIPLVPVNRPGSPVIDYASWENADWMFWVSEGLVKEKTPDGKYFITDSKGRRAWSCFTYF